MNTQYALPHVFFTLMHQCISFIRVWVKIFLMCLSHNLYVDVFVRVISHLFNVTVYSRLLTIRLYTIYIRDTVFHYKLKELFFFFLSMLLHCTNFFYYLNSFFKYRHDYYVSFFYWRMHIRYFLFPFFYTDPLHFFCFIFKVKET